MNSFPFGPGFLTQLRPLPCHNSVYRRPLADDRFGTHGFFGKTRIVPCPHGLRRIKNIKNVAGKAMGLNKTIIVRLINRSGTYGIFEIRGLSWIFVSLAFEARSLNEETGTHWCLL